jgi:hypothetical protein
MKTRPSFMTEVGTLKLFLKSCIEILDFDFLGLIFNGYVDSQGGLTRMACTSFAYLE